MSEYSNDFYMQLNRTSQATIFAMTIGAKAVVGLMQFLMRLHREDVEVGYDIVIVARKPAIDSGYDKYERALIHLLKLHHIYKDT